jgi:hypothetical protein
MPQHYQVIVIDSTSQFPVSAFRADRPALPGPGEAPPGPTRCNRRSQPGPPPRRHPKADLLGGIFSV